MTSLTLPQADGSLQTYQMGDPVGFPSAKSGKWRRVAFAAAHVVPDPRAAIDPWVETAVDWEATLAYRHYLWDLGFGVAEAMDTAQRGMGLDWAASLELIRRSVAAAEAYDGTALIASGAGTDHLPDHATPNLNDVKAAYEEQCAAVEAAGGRIILMASRALVKAARSSEDYIDVYDTVLRQVKEPVIIHWLGEMFDPALAGYWGAEDHAHAMDTCLTVLQAHADKIDGIKISLLDADKEIHIRRRLPKSIRMYTGDDFNYPALIAGDDLGYSDALLGIFDAIAPAAAAALSAHSEDDLERYHNILAPTVPLSRHIFRAPTRFYKTGVVFMAYLNGMQDHFTMVGGQQSARSLLHLAQLFRLADNAGLLRDPERACDRMRHILAVHGAAA